MVDDVAVARERAGEGGEAGEMGALTLEVMQRTVVAGEAGVDGEGARTAAGRAGEAARFRRLAASQHRRVEEEVGETEAEQVAAAACLGAASSGGDSKGRRRPWQAGSSGRLGFQGSAGRGESRGREEEMHGSRGGLHLTTMGGHGREARAVDSGMVRQCRALWRQGRSNFPENPLLHFFFSVFNFK